MRTNEIKNEIDETRKWEEETKGSDLKYETKITYMIFCNMKRQSCTHKANMVELEEDKSNLLNNILEFNNKSRPRSKEGKDKKEILMKEHMLFTRVKNHLLMISKVKDFQ